MWLTLVGASLPDPRNTLAIILFAAPDTEGDADFGILIVTVTPTPT